MPCIEMAEGIELDRIVELAKIALKELPLPFPADDEEIFTAVYVYWEQAPCFVLKISGQIVGFAGLRLTKAPFSKMPMLQDYLFFVLPEHRNINNIKALCKAARDFSDSTDLPLRLDYTISGNQNTQERLLKRMGFRVAGITGVYHE